MTENNQDKLALIAEKAWFNNLIEDIQGIVLDIKKQSWSLIVYYHKIGSRILQDKETFIEQGYSMGEMMKILSSQVNRSDSTLYRCVQFYEFYPDIKTSPYGEDASWFQITKDLAKLEASKKDKEGKSSKKKEKQEEASKEEKKMYPQPQITFVYDEKDDMYELKIDKKDFTHIRFSDELKRYIASLSS